jgi:DNA polymerase III subunit beta
MRADRRALHAVMSVLARVIGSKPSASMPILADVRITAASGATEATLTATDLTTTLTCKPPIESNGTPFDVCVDAKTLVRVLKPEGRRSGADVAFEGVDDHGVVVRLDGMTTKLPGLDPQNFPAGVGSKVGDGDWHLAGMWPAEELREALSFTLPAASTDITRPHLCCVLISTDAIVATDGHRLHKTPGPGPMKEPLLLGTGAADVLARILASDEQVVVATAEDIIRFRCGPWQLDTKRIDEKFPPWEMVVPRADSQTVHVSVQAGALAEAVARVMHATGERKAKVRVNGTLALSAWAASVGEADVTVPVLENSHHGDDLVIGLDLAYVRDALAHGNATAELGFDGELDPVRVDLPSERVAVIMPLRV